MGNNCSKCGSIINQGERFCQNCGTSIITNTIPINNNVNPHMGNIAESQNNSIHQELSSLNSDFQNASYQSQTNTNFGNNGNQNSSNGFKNALSLILGIVALSFLFRNRYIGVLLGISAVITSIKIPSSHSKQSKIIGIIAVILNLLFIIGSIAGIKVLEHFGFTVSDKNLMGEWSCTSDKSFFGGYESYNDTMNFNNGKYTFVLNGVTTSDKYKIEPATYDKSALDEVKFEMKPYLDITEDEPKIFKLNTNNNGTINIIKLNTINMGEIIFVYSADTYVCKKSSNNDNNKTDNIDTGSLILTVPSGFKVSDKNDEALQSYEYTNMLELCDLKISNVENYANQTAREFLEESISFLDATRKTNIESKKIKNRNWETIIIRTDQEYELFANLREYMYVTEYKGKMYTISFTNYQNNSTYCNNAYNTIINSLDFK